MRQRGLRAATRCRVSGDMVFLLSGVVSAATASRRVSLTQLLLGHPAERVDSKNRLVCARSHTKFYIREFGSFLFPFAFREGLVWLLWLANKLLFEHSVCISVPSSGYTYRVRFVKFVCGNVLPQPVSACASHDPHDDRSTRNTIRSREAMDGTTLLRDNR